MAGEISTGEIYGRCHFLKEWLFLFMQVKRKLSGKGEP